MPPRPPVSSPVGLTRTLAGASAPHFRFPAPAPVVSGAHHVGVCEIREGRVAWKSSVDVARLVKGLQWPSSRRGVRSDVTAEQRLADLGRCVASHGRGYVAVEVHEQCRVGVAQAFRGHLWRYTAGEHQGGAGVAEPVGRC